MIKTLFDVIIDLPPNDQNVGSKWLFKKKNDMDGYVYTYKARLVAKGFIQTYNVDYGETFSPVTDVRAIRIPLAILAFSSYVIEEQKQTWFLPTAGDDQIILGFSTNPNMLFTAANGVLPAVVYKCLRLLHSVAASMFSKLPTRSNLGWNCFSQQFIIIDFMAHFWRFIEDVITKMIDYHLFDVVVKFHRRNEDFVKRRDIGLPEDIYAAVDSCETAQEIWLRVQQMMDGFEIGDEEKKAKLFNEWEKFTSTNGESIESYYHRNLDGIEEVNILMANLQQASTSGTQTDKAPVYDLDGSAEVHEYDNCYNNEIFNMFTQEEQYIELLEPIFKPHKVQQNDSNVISTLSSVQQSRGTIE
nr:putative retrotransposon Ty1-copia subclass protein [Tanacetum cinerariifolium]